MVIKDFNATENEDRESKKISDAKENGIKSPKEDEKNAGQSEIKNAHATGDGSFGRNESRLPDEEVKKEQGNGAY